MDSPSLITGLLPFVVANTLPYLIAIIALVLFVGAHRRLAKAQEEMLKSHQELNRQLATLTCELRQLANRQQA